jgi:hypothetical protein
MTFDEVENDIAPSLVGDAAQDRQQVTEGVKPLSNSSKPKIRQIVLLLYQLPLLRYPPLPAKGILLVAFGAECVGNMQENVSVAAVPK